LLDDNDLVPGVMQQGAGDLAELWTEVADASQRTCTDQVGAADAPGRPCEVSARTGL
jgi:hypothetical protein